MVRDDFNVKGGHISLVSCAFKHVSCGMQKWTGLLFLFLFLMCACNSQQRDPTHSIEHQFPITESFEVVIDMQAGKLVVFEYNEDTLKIEAVLGNPDVLSISQDNDGLFIDLDEAVESDSIVLHIPQNVNVHINTFAADVFVQGALEQLEIRSIAGDIELRAFSGTATLWAGRGAIEVSKGVGDLVVIGEHGVLTVDSFDGSVSMSTIMGTIQYTAPAFANHNVHLETDHGPVRAWLPGNVDLDVIVKTTSGYVTCTGKAFRQTANGCTGLFNAALETLSVRTVSGRVELWEVSNPQDAQNE